jgi:hypothetical protein
MIPEAGSDDRIPPAPLLANARMYSTTSRETNDACMTLLRWAVARAGGNWHLMKYPGSAPLDELWASGGAEDAIDALLSDRIDVGPMDRYALDLVKNLWPAIAGQLCVLDKTTRRLTHSAFYRNREVRSILGRKIASCFRSCRHGRGPSTATGCASDCRFCHASQNRLRGTAREGTGGERTSRRVVIKGVKR